MKLLLFTQKIDKNDQTLGFMCNWISELSQKMDSIEVICLQKGEFDLPQNVTVYSLGKEEGVGRLGIIINLYKYLHLISGSYDKVFVHMNQEYVLLAGIYWRIKNIPIYLWRNHPRGNLLTLISIMISNKVFCTSTSSFTAKFKKTVVMPAGIDTKIFKPVEGVIRKKYSVAMIGRISPIKNIELGLEAIRILSQSGVQTSMSIVGPIPNKDSQYAESLKKYVEKNNLSSVVHFLPGVEPFKLPEIYSSFEICLNLTEDGSFDKTILESTSCGTIPLVSNTSLKGMLPDICITGSSPETIAGSIEKLIDATEQVKIQKDLENFVEKGSLDSLVLKLTKEMN